MAHFLICGSPSCSAMGENTCPWVGVPGGPLPPAGREAPLPQASDWSPFVCLGLARLGSLVLKRDLPEASM